MAAQAKLEVRGVAARLRAHVEAFPDKEAVIYPDGGGYAHRTYRQLDDESDAYAAGLRRVGIGKGTKTVLILRPGPDLFAVLFALLKVGAVPVVVDPGMGLRRMLHCYRATGADAFIGIPPAHAIRVLNRRAFGGVRTLVTAGRRWFWGGHTLRSLGVPRSLAQPTSSAQPAQPAESAAAAPADDDLLMIGFTTGSTGPAKGVESTHGALDAMVRQVAAAHDQGPDDVGLVTSPLFGVLHLLIGSTCVLAPVDPTRVANADPALIADLIERFGVTAMFASPALLGPLGRHLARTGRRLPTLRCLVSGGAPVSDEIVSSLHSGQTRLHTTYGATEALPIASIDSAEILRETVQRTHSGGGACVGRPVAGLDVRVLRATDEPMPTWSDTLLVAPGQVGEITIAGPTVSRRYHALPAANLAAKIADGDRVWHRTGDLGRVDEAGRIWFCGRKSQRVRTAAGPMDTVRCEGVLNAHPDVYRTALVGVGGEPVVCVELRGGVPATERGRVTRQLRELAGRYEVTRGLDTFLFHPSFPVDIRHNAKINREYLSGWAQRQLRPRRLRDLAPRIVPVAGWTYLVYGLTAGFGHPVLWILFWVDAFLSIVLHGLQIPAGVRRGRMAGYPATRSALLTFVFGATWWKGLP
ncbi:MAG: AMP-binding protein [Dactylosporangium sp.]|nr:AMP-binding protein [Dactylosporangium sp.]